jgi:hypothetical protein
LTEDYYGEEGCCLNCSDAHDGCLCFSCKCRKCDWYEFDYLEDSGYCNKVKIFEDYEREAIEVKEILENKYPRGSHLIALFSDGAHKRSINYFTPSDVPYKIKLNFGVKTRTLLLKSVSLMKNNQGSAVL